MSAIRYFKVLGATHVNEEGKSFEVGKVCPTRVDLVKEFGSHKFRETDKKGRPLTNDPGDADSDGDATDLEEDLDAPAVTKEAKKLHEKKAATDNEGENAGDAGDDEGEKLKSDLGDDVTSKFDKELVADNDFVVFHKGKKYFVAERDAPNKALNEEDLTSKEAVTEFVDEYVNPKKK